MYCYFGPYSIEIEKEEIDLSPPEQYGPFSYEDMRLIVRRTLERIFRLPVKGTESDNFLVIFHS
jgi:hypothetical protein